MAGRLPQEYYTELGIITKSKLKTLGLYHPGGRIPISCQTPEGKKEKLMGVHLRKRETYAGKAHRLDKKKVSSNSWGKPLRCLVCAENHRKWFGKVRLNKGKLIQKKKTGTTTSGNRCHAKSRKGKRTEGPSQRLHFPILNNRGEGETNLSEREIEDYASES